METLRRFILIKFACLGLALHVLAACSQRDELPPHVNDPSFPIHEAPVPKHYSGDGQPPRGPSHDLGRSVDEVSTSLDDVDFSPVPSWDGNIIDEAFRRARDRRFLPDEDHTGFLRRIAWLYPDDGCYARATLMISNLEEFGYPRPAKIYVFGGYGDLRLITPYAPDGAAWWEFHVAPIVSIGSQYYVMDPAVNPSSPLTLNDWIGKIAVIPGNLKIAVCSSYSYNPEDTCNIGKRDVETAARNDHVQLLLDEWDRVESIGHDPEKELGDAPPW